MAELGNPLKVLKTLTPGQSHTYCICLYGKFIRIQSVKSDLLQSVNVKAAVVETKARESIVVNIMRPI